MKFLLSPSTGIIAFTRQPTCRRACAVRLQQRRCMSGTYEAYAEALMKAKRRSVDRKPQTKLDPRVNANSSGGGMQRGVVVSREEVETEPPPPPPPPLSFAALGFDTSLVRALQTAFPNVQQPTRIQERLVPEIMAGKDILLRDETGSGKSFGLVLALLNKPRMVIHDERGSGKRRVITTLFIVPHRDLALQILHWIERITTAMHPSPPLASIAQVLVRGATAKPLATAIEDLKATPPHILICTPQALMEVYKEDKEALQLSTLSTVVVDEVDYLVETAARKEEGKAYMAAYEKKLRKLELHPGPTREILDVIYAGRKELARNTYDPEEDVEGEYESVAEWRNEMEAEARHPQLVLSSATLRVHLKDYLFGESGWLNPYNIVKIMGATASAVRGGKSKEKGRILHSVLVVSDGDVRNVESAVAAPELEMVTAAAADVAGEKEEEEEGKKRYYNEKYGHTPSPFDVNALEAVATGFALDVPSIGLLVIPSSAPVQRAVYELREMGVNAEGLDVQIGSKGKDYLLQKDVDVVQANPRLLVATLATTRGLDLPELSHVFILGVPEGPKVNGRTVDAYVHIAGRVGRFGRVGRVITVLASDDGWRLERILSSIGERPVRFDHFD